MEQIQDFSDERLKCSCIHCGQWIACVDSNKDHVPSKALLEKPYPAHLPIIEICETCNSSFSADEEYLVALLGAIRAGTATPNPELFPRAHRILHNSPKLRARIDRTRSEYQTADGQTRIIWKPELPRIENVVLKNARGHAYYELGDPMQNKPERLVMRPLESLTDSEFEEFEHINGGPIWPEVGSRMMTRLVTGQDLEDSWIIVQDSCYRYAVIQQGLVIVKMVIAEYLAAEVVWNPYSGV